MTARISRRLTLAGAGAAALGGCSTVLSRPASVQRTLWPLAASRPTALPRRTRGKVLVVGDFRAAPGLDQVGLQWLQPDGSVHVDFYNVWAVQPAQALTDDMRRWLAASGLFAAVVGPDSGLTADLTLDGELVSLVATPHLRQGRAAASLTLLDPRATPPRVLMQRPVSAAAPMPTDTPAGVAAALQAAVVGVLQRTQADLTPYARGR